MRIALVGRRFDPDGGGTERDLIVTAGILTRAGHRVVIYADEVRAPSDEFELRRVAAVRLGRALRLFGFAARAATIARRAGSELVLSFARIIGADIIRSGGGAHSSYVRAARQWQSMSGVTLMRLSPYHRAQVAIERAGYASPRLECAIAVSELVRRDLLKTFDLPSEKIVTLYNGVDLERFRPNADSKLRAEARRELAVPEDGLAIAFVGNGFARKGLKFLIDAWPLVDPKAHLVVAGADRAADKYRRRAAELGVGDRVRLLGSYQHVERLFAAVDGLAMPSLFEPFGNVVLEAMATGLPVLCSKACGAAELLPAELRELVVEDPTDLGELARRLNLLVRCAGDPILKSVLRSTAEQYSWDRHARELLSIIGRHSLAQRH